MSSIFSNEHGVSEPRSMVRVFGWLNSIRTAVISLWRRSDHELRHTSVRKATCLYVKGQGMLGIYFSVLNDNHTGSFVHGGVIN